MRSTRRLFLAGLVVLATGCGDPDPESTFLARAGSFQLTVAEAAELLAQVDTMETPRRAAMALANLWVDYTLLAMAAAEDSTLSQLELGPVVDDQIEQQMAMALRDSVARANATVPEAEVTRRLADAEGTELRVRQIRIDVPPDAPPARHDSAREALESLRSRIVEEGASFAELAREHSQDPMSAQEGGDLGFFGPGDMVAPFDSTARSLEIGEVGGPVRTVYGWHLIRLEERRTPTRERLRARLQRQQAFQATNAYLAELEETYAPQIDPDAVNAFRQLAANPEAELSVETPDTLVRYVGGALTLDDLRAHMRVQSAPTRQEMAAADPAQVRDRGLRPLVRQQIVLAEARQQGLGPSPQVRDAAVDTLRQWVRSRARDLGLLPMPADENARAAIAQAVDELMVDIVANGRSITQLGPVSRVLRQRYPHQIRDDRTLLVERILNGGEGAGGEADSGDEGAGGETDGGETDGGEADSGGGDG